jgi:hypothetical protein
MQLFVNDIPNGVNHRRVRKCIGAALLGFTGEKKKFKFLMWKYRGGTRGKLIMADDEQQTSDILVNRRYPIVCKDKVLKFEFARAREEEVEWDLKQVEAIRMEDVESDYEPEKGEAEEIDRYLKLSQVSCGAWDSSGHYVDAWRRNCQPSQNWLMIDEDKGQLTIGIPNGAIIINLYNVKYTIADTTAPFYYLVLAGLPTFLQLDSAVPTRVSDFGGVHTACASYSYVYRVRYNSNLRGFANFHARRLVVPDLLGIQVSTIETITTKRLEEDLDGFYRSLAFDIAFQIQTLVTAWQLMPIEVFVLRDSFKALGAKTGATRVKALASEIKWRDPRPSMNKNVDIAQMQLLLSHDPSQMNIDRLEEEEVTSDVRARLAFYGGHREIETSDAVLIHALTVSPAGMQLSGPHRDPGNRVLRKYPGLDDQYLRVSFRDEMGEPIKEMRDVDGQSKILYGKFLDILNKGVVVAGVKFDFLAFSNSQLKSYSCWFVRSPLVVDGSKIVTAQDIRDSIGNLSSIQCPPKFAARLGQAFTTTIYSIKVPINQIYQIPDHKSPCGKYDFTDGVGKISSDMVALLNQEARKGGLVAKGKTANVFQIRLDGAKGVLALDTRLQGSQIHLRKSMIKFRSNDTEWELAVAKADTVPGVCFLNRPLIALLESLDVPFESFQKLQNEALLRIEKASRTPQDAGRLLHETGLGISTRISSTFNSLCKDFGLQMDDLMAIPFLRDVVRTALFHSLRSIKYKARIPVPEAYTLMGVVDETNTLKEDEVYACLRGASGERRALKGRLLVSRSPTLHPGDVQMAAGIGQVAQTSPLYALTNCLVFSQQGARPLPSMLGGGDLDGDLYNVIQDARLFPRFVTDAAEYAPVTPTDIGRPVQKEDITRFFVGYIIADKVGMLANKHLIVSDQQGDGVLSEKCLQLAELHSTAIDFPKTGYMPDLSDLPRTYGKPDYMESEYRIEERYHENTEQFKVLERDPGVIYKSRKTLGRLFRSIEVPLLISKWGLDDSTASGEIEWKDALLERFKPADSRWRRFLQYHRRLVQFYYQEEQALANGYHTGGRTASLTSAEVFLGCTMVKSPYQSRKQLYDLTESLQANFRDMVTRFLQAASSPPEAEEEAEGESAEHIRKTQLDYDDVVDYEDDLEQFEVETQVSWQTNDMDLDGTASTTTYDDGRTTYSQYGEERKARELHLAMYSLFFAALEYTTEDASQMSCPWVVYPRLVAAHKNVERLSAWGEY